MNIFLKTFLILSAVTIAVLSVITLYQYTANQNTQIENTTQFFPEKNEDRVQQAITPISEPNNSLLSGTVAINVDNFMNFGMTFEDPVNPNNYILSDNLEYCVVDGSCINNQVSSNFSIRFDATDGVFYVQLLEQPIEEARRTAESFLTKVLQISRPELCELNYYMSVLESVDKQFSGKHLQFTACAGSQRLQ